jgi:signal transduction histidine kinase
MESLMFDGLTQWLLYAVSALACFWAWDRMFFWVSQKDLKAFVRILGAVLLFTPAPLDVEANQHAPAFIVILFRTFLENNASIYDAVIYMLAGLFIGLILMSVLSLINFLRAKFSSAQ